jgi:hypothetical protein
VPLGAALEAVVPHGRQVRADATADGQRRREAHPGDEAEPPPVAARREHRGGAERQQAEDQDEQHGAAALA